MIPATVFSERRDTFCKVCEHWRGVCLRGHSLGSPAGCPLKKFPPIDGADYALDREPAQLKIDCCSQESLPDLTWPQVLAQFAQSMVNWAASGLSTVDSAGHGARYGICKQCEEFKGFQCKACRCVAYAKAKLATEQCPKGKW